MTPRLVSLSDYPDITLGDVLTVIGRHQDCDVRIASSRISRHHCCLAIDGDQVVVRDLGSSNGTWINGARLGGGRLRSGDVLAIAHIRYRLEGCGANGAVESNMGSDRPARRSNPDVVLPHVETLPDADVLRGPGEPPPFDRPPPRR